MSPVREPAVAGSFYPADPHVLAREVDALLAGAPMDGETETSRGRLVALVAPHAGYMYSGPVAARAYRLLAARAPDVDRVVLLGPAHVLFLQGIAAPAASAFRTPLGDVSLDREGLDLALGRPPVRELSRAHQGEHGLEVHLPFLQRVLGEFPLVPLVVGVTEPGDVADLLEDLCAKPGTLVVVSTDLSHYLLYEEAKQADAETARVVERRQVEAVTSERACGVFPLRGLLAWARRHDFGIRTLGLANSGDAGGPRGSVVGYGAFAVEGAR